jgi:mono/diheme cytochrome c family protein
LREVQAGYESLARGGDKDLIEALSGVYGRLEKAHALMELEGIELPPLPRHEGTKPPPSEPAIPAAGVSFANDIAPLLLEHCANCHGRGRRPSGGWDVTSFAKLVKGGDNGSPLVAGKPAESLLIGKLKGTADGQRMPLRQPPLPDEQLARFEQWIREGAGFDGPDENQDLAQVAGTAKAARATHEELSAARMKLALKNWELVLAGTKPDQAETENFFLIGNVGAQTLQNIGQTAESLVPRIAELLGVPAAGPLVKGRLTLVILAQRYDYTEFGKMVEQRDLPPAWRGHWRYNVADAYGVLIPPRGDEYTLEALLAQQIAGAYVASLGDMPSWFAEGTARLAAARVQPKDARVAAWDAELPKVTAGLTALDEFLAGNLPPERADVIAYGFVRFLAGDGKRLAQLLAARREGPSFEQAFAAAYNQATPGRAAQLWLTNARRGSR